jgi:acetolactate synthase-1/2/3 large subunit
MLLQAERPFVIAGGSGWDAPACDALQRFAEGWQLPVGCAFRFQDTLDNRHPNYAGDVGIGINPRLAQRIADADLVIALGARLGEMTTGGYTLLAAPRPLQKLVHVHAGPRNWAASMPPTCCCSRRWPAPRRRSTLAAPATLPGPTGLAPRMPTTRPTWSRRRSSRWTWRRRADAAAPRAAGHGLHQRRRQLQRLAAPLLPLPGLARHGRTQLAPTAGAMGYGLPAAVAASLLYPQRTVVNLAGDGDFLMTGQELATAVQYGATRLISIVVDNGSYGTIRMHQEREYPGRVSGTELFQPGLRGAGAGLRVARRCVERPRSSSRRCARALDSGRPSLLHLKLPTEVITSRTTLTAIRERTRGT